INDAEIPSIIYSTFKDLGFDSFTIKINNRKVLKGFFQWLGIEDSTEILRTVDKLEKIGLNGVIKELEEQGLETITIDKILEFIQIKGSNKEKLNSLEDLKIENGIDKEGLEELKDGSHYVVLFGVPENNYNIDL